MMGVTIGPIVVSIFYDIGGYSLPYFICALICLFGVYAFSQVPQVDETLYKKEKVEKKSNNNENVIEKKEKKDLLRLLNFSQMLFLTGCIVLKTNSIDFYLPTLVNHLKETWDVSISIASLFFLSSIISNAIILQKIDKFIFLGNFLIISLGLFLTGLTSFIIAPISIFPHSYWTILTGIFIMGINGCLIIVPSFFELNNFSRALYPYSNEMQNYVRNFFFRFSFQIADFISPIIGSLFYTHYSFEASAYFTGFITLFFWVIFSFYYKDHIKSYFTPKNLEESSTHIKQSNIIPSTDIN
jgi:MFS family permease